MSGQKNDGSPSDALIAPLTIPAESKVPDPDTGLSTPDEYDLYFRILRDHPGLLQWSRACLSVHDAQLEDLDRTSLTAEEKCHVLRGMLLIQRTTLEKWVKALETHHGDT
jgi:hypothetical protein